MAGHPEIRRLVYGYAFDADHAAPLRSLGRKVLFQNAEIRPPLLAQATSQRVGRHVAATNVAVHPAHHRDGAFILGAAPSSPEIVLLRLGIRATPGGPVDYFDDVQSDAVILGGKHWSDRAPELIRRAPEMLTPRRWSIEEVERGYPERDAPAPPQTLQKVSSSLVDYLAQACIDGRSIALDGRTCPSRDNFLATAATVAKALPKTMRRDLTVSVGLTLPEPWTLSWLGPEAVFAETPQAPAATPASGSLELLDQDLLAGGWRNAELVKTADKALLTALGGALDRRAASLHRIAPLRGLIWRLAQLMVGSNSLRGVVEAALRRLATQNERVADVVWLLALQLTPRDARAARGSAISLPASYQLAPEAGEGLRRAAAS